MTYTCFDIKKHDFYINLKLGMNHKNEFTKKYDKTLRLDLKRISFSTKYLEFSRFTSRKHQQI